MNLNEDEGGMKRKKKRGLERGQKGLESLKGWKGQRALIHSNSQFTIHNAQHNVHDDISIRKRFIY